MEFGLILTSQFGGKWEHVVSDAAAAEAGGLDSVWLADHLLTPADPTRPAFEAWAATAALAALTAGVRIGHLVGCVSFRNVGLLAKMAVTVDHASGGRLDLGLGAGWYEEEYRAFGYPFPTPGDRRRAFTETLDALELLFTGEAVSYAGEFVRLSEARCLPQPVQQPRPPLTIGTGGKLMRRLAGARADAWNCPAGLLPDVAGARAEVDAGAGGRTVRTTVQIPAAVGRDRGEADAALEVGRVHMGWMGDVAEVGLVGTVAEAVDTVEAYRNQGVDGFLCVVPGTRRRPDFIAALAELAAVCR